MKIYNVAISARKVGAIGAHGTIRRTYQIEVRGGEDVNHKAIDRAYQDGDIEHVRIISKMLVK